MTAVRATRITDGMMTAAAAAIGQAATILHDKRGMLLPDRAQLPATATAVARAVARAAVADGVAPAAQRGADRPGRAADPVGPPVSSRLTGGGCPIRRRPFVLTVKASDSRWPGPEEQPCLRIWP